MAVTFVTGPMEQEGTGVTSVRVKVSNQSGRTVTAEVRIFDLNGRKVIIGSRTLTVPRLSSAFATFGVSGTGQYEVEIELSSAVDVFVSSWGRNAAGVPLAVHRVLHAEMAVKNGSSGSSKNRDDDDD